MRLTRHDTRGELFMTRKRHSDKKVLKLLHKIELKLTNCDDMASTYRSVGIDDATHYNWRKRFVRMCRSQLSDTKRLETQNARMTKIVAGLEPSKLILKESLKYLQIRA